MFIDTPVLETETASLSPEELIPFLEDKLHNISLKPKRKSSHALVVKIPEEKREMVINHFLSED